MNLSFRLGKIPVRIHPSFLFVAVFFGLGGGTNLGILLAWVAIVCVSVILHELGHASMGLAFGLAPKIELHSMGGTTSWSGGARLTTARRIAISVAGPGAGFVVAAVVRYVLGPLFPPTELAAFAYRNLLFVNFYWGLFNLMPVLPLDGGNVMMELLGALTGGRGERPARIVSIVVAALALPVALLLQNWWIGLLAAWFISMNFRGLKDAAARDHDGPLKPSLEEAYAALHIKDGARMLALARPVALSSRTAPVRAEALQLVAFGFLLEGRVHDADAAIAALPPGYSPHPSLLEMRARAAG